MATEARARLRPAGFDDLGLRRALSDRLLPALVAAMAFLAALALAGFLAAAGLSRHWREGAAAALTVQVPDPGEPGQGGDHATRREAVLALLRATPGIANMRPLSEGELADLLHPWLGASATSLAVPLPAVIAVRTAETAPDLAALAARLTAAAPGALIESHGAWVARLLQLIDSLRACAALALLVVVGVAALVVVVATRAGLSARRQAIEIVHGLGATDGYIAARFAARTRRLAFGGGMIGALAALPVLLQLAHLAAPFTAPLGAERGAASGVWLRLLALPAPLWLGLALLPPAAALLGWLTAQATVRAWLRRLP